MSKICCLYAFTDLDTVTVPTKQVQGQRASHEYRRWYPTPSKNNYARAPDSRPAGDGTAMPRATS